MNVNDIEDMELEGDKLDLIFARQKELMEKYHDIEKATGLLQTEDVPVDMHSAQGQARLKDFAWRITEELGEAMNCLKNKPWKKTQMLTDVTHYKEELADAFHFMIELMILSGMDAFELAMTYMKKSEVNKFRQRSEY
ncbi:hypothetical protein GWN42_26045 [candidate division KSB1 bacterium]|nr:hypothetical protein [candidate division KSB1 bacterium]